MNLISQDHEILPQPGSVRDWAGQPGELLNQFAYPVTAVCSVCGQAITAASFYAEFRHLRTEPGNQASA